jgi:hypothetical protein
MAHLDVDVVIAMQLPVSVCTNPRGDKVMRQEGHNHRKEGAWIVITPMNAKRRADAVMALAESETAPATLTLPASAHRTGADQQRRCRARRGHTVTPTVVVADHEGNGATDLFEGARADRRSSQHHKPTPV